MPCVSKSQTVANPVLGSVVKNYNQYNCPNTIKYFGDD